MMSRLQYIDLRYTGLLVGLRHARLDTWLGHYGCLVALCIYIERKSSSARHRASVRLGDYCPASQVAMALARQLLLP